MTAIARSTISLPLPGKALPSLTLERGGARCFAAYLADSEGSSDEHRPVGVELAELFNEHGFFPPGDPVEANAPMSRVAPRAAAVSQTAGRRPASKGLTPGLPAAGTAGAQVAAVLERAARRDLPAHEIGSPAETGAPGPGADDEALAPVVPAVTNGGVSEARLAGAAQSAAAASGSPASSCPSLAAQARQAQPRPGSGQGSQARFTFALGDHGIELLARFELLAADEEARLLEALSGLLARHGFSFGDVRINGKRAMLGSFSGGN